MDERIIRLDVTRDELVTLSAAIRSVLYFYPESVRGGSDPNSHVGKLEKLQKMVAAGIHGNKNPLNGAYCLEGSAAREARREVDNRLKLWKGN